MRASELRIGNWVKKREFLTERKFVEITVTSEDFATCVVQPKDYKPIPLTEEWLIKLKFTKRTEIESINAYYLNVNDLHFGAIVHDDGSVKMWLYCNGHTVFSEINHVHTFQNIHQLILTNGK